MPRIFDIHVLREDPNVHRRRPFAWEIDALTGDSGPDGRFIAYRTDAELSVERCLKSLLALVGVLIVAAGAGMAPVAQAARLDVENGRFTYVADAGDSDLVRIEPNGVNKITVVSNAALRAADGCLRPDPLDPHVAICGANPLTAIVVHLGDGNDSVNLSVREALGRSASVFGGPGDDKIVGTERNDALDGGDGQDRLEGRAGADSLAGGAGNDLLTGFGGFGDVTVDGADTLTGGAGNDGLRGDYGNDELSGGDGADELLGFEDGDRLDGGAGPDVLDGGEGIDTVSYATSGAAVRVAVGVPSGSGTGGGTEQDTVATTNEIVVGSPFGDRLIGTAAPDNLNGAAGSDVLQGGPGGDVLIGGTGIDTTSYEDRSDPIVFSTAAGSPAPDNDALTGIEGAAGGSGADMLTGDGGPNILRGGPGADVLRGHEGEDVLQGGPGADTLDGGADLDAVDYADRATGVVVTLGGDDDDGNLQDGPAGSRDSLTALEDAVGGRGDDTLTGTDGRNELRGGVGNDNLEGAGGLDVMDGQDGDDMLSGGLGGDILTGGPGSDRLLGDEDGDLLFLNDGAPDIGACGTGTDAVEADLQDNILVPRTGPDCESVSQAPVRQHPTVRIRSRFVHVNSRAAASVRLYCPRAIRRGCKGVLRLGLFNPTQPTVRLGLRGYRIARGADSVVTVRLSPAARRTLLRRRGALVRVVAREQDFRGRAKRMTATLTARRR